MDWDADFVRLLHASEQGKKRLNGLIVACIHAETQFDVARSIVELWEYSIPEDTLMAFQKTGEVIEIFRSFRETILTEIENDPRRNDGFLLEKTEFLGACSVALDIALRSRIQRALSLLLQHPDELVRKRAKEALSEFLGKTAT